MSGVIDPTISANYPVILGDGLLGQNPTEIFTGIKYNHRLNQSPPSNARLKPSLPGSTSSFDLGYTDEGKQYAYEGTRNIGDHQYVLYFDPERKAFILDKIDSTFNMNLTRTPDNSDPDSLRRLYPNIGSEINSAIDNSAKPSIGNLGSGSSKEAKKAAAANHRKSPLMPPKKKTEKKTAKSIELALPEPATPKPKPAKKKKADDEDDEDEEEDDGGLLIEYPDAPDPKTKSTDFSPAFPSVRRFDDFMDARESEGDDADGESEDEVEDFRLPSPVNNSRAADEIEVEAPGLLDAGDAMEVDQPENSQDGQDEDMEADLEKELADAFEDYENSNQGTPAADGGNSILGTPVVAGGDDESEISEED